MFVILPIAANYLKLSDAPITMIAFAACIIKVLIYCFSPDKNTLYLVLVVALFDELFNSTITSSLSKVVDSEEIGKVQIQFLLSQPQLKRQLNLILPQLKLGLTGK